MTTTLSTSLEDRLDRLSAQVGLLVAEAEANRAFKESVSEITGDLTPIAKQGLESVSRVMAEFEDKGYLEFARSGAGVVDRIVTSFSRDDVEALGDNIVLILETVKEMTQPDVMRMLQTSFHNVSEIEEETVPPSTFALLRQMRDPEVRRGLERLIAVLKSMGQTGPRFTKERKET